MCYSVCFTLIIIIINDEYVKWMILNELKYDKINSSSYSIFNNKLFRARNLVIYPN